MDKKSTCIFQSVIGETEEMLELKNKVCQVAKCNSTVLITGETGTGKGLIAKAIHKASTRKNYPFIEINCGAIPESLIESELFGYSKGAFTGALKDGKKGRFLAANKGSIFLDEIGEMPLHLQVKLLHVLQNRIIEPIGSTVSIPIDIRIIAASNRDLETMMNDGTFRKDLYFRLGVIPLHIPPLRKRKEDIPLLAEYIKNIVLKRTNKDSVMLSPECTQYLQNYYWPGNVRELENVIEYATNMCCDNYVTELDLPEKIKSTTLTVKEKTDSTREYKTYKEELLLWEYRLFSDLLKQKGNTTQGKQEIAKDLDIGIATLYRKLAKFNF
ncbi:MAG: sigma 54-interacting transcriptional regulator [Clostridiales bacterium]